LFQNLQRVGRTRSNVFKSLQVRMFSSDADLKKTALYDAHLEFKGKMVPFGGWALPVQYSDSIISSHHHVRNSAGLFDVSHMGQLIIRGKKAMDYLEFVTVADVHALNVDQSRLSVITNENGGIIDDCMITRKEDYVYMVINAGCIDKDLKHMHEQLAVFNSKHNADVTIDYIQDRALLALQGPKAASVLEALLPADYNLTSQDFTYTRTSKVGKFDDCWIARCGYTGEDGFEISVPNKDAIPFMHTLLENTDVLPAGLGVRDSLRLEAGLCLYGHDLDETITPIEAGLAWTITKRRRAEGGFIGFDTISKHLKEGITRKRVGLEILKGAPAREGADILDSNGEKIGHITSGTISPTLKKKISMGYVEKSSSKLKTQLQVSVRGKVADAVVVKMPFVPSNYYKAT